MIFTPSEDYGLIRHILTNAKCFRRMKNDTAPPIERFSVGPTPGVQFIIADCRGFACGVFLLASPKSGGAEVHFCILPEWWGQSHRIGAAFLEWVWDNTSLTHLIGPVPAYNALALRLAKSVGFKKIFSVGSGVRRNGVSYDLIHLQMERPVTANDQSATARS